MAGLRLIAQSLLRERGLFGLWTLSLCIAVTGLLVVDVFRQSLTHTLQVQGQKILSADVSVAVRRSLSNEEQVKTRELFPPATRYAVATEMLAMVTRSDDHGGASRLGTIRFVDEVYPLAGDLQIATATGIAQKSGRELADGAWVAPDLLTLLDLKLGDKIKIGNVEFKISGSIHKDSTQTLRLGSMAPRLYVSRKFLADSGLIQFGSTFSETLYALFPKPIADAKSKLERLFLDPSIQVTIPTDLEQGSFRVLSRLLDYLGLTGLVTLCLGWIGIYYLGRRWLSLEAVSAGILKCLGFSTRELRTYLVTKLLLILVTGIALGGALSWLVAQALFPLVRASLPAEFTLVWSASSTVLLILVGPLSGLLLMLPSILGIAREAPLALVAGLSSFKTSLWDFIAFSLTTASLFFVITLAQARSWQVTFIFLGALLATVALVAIIGFLGIKLLRSLSSGGRQGWRTHLALAMWTRRRALTILMITVSAMSGMLSQLVPHLEKTLVGELQAPADSDRPALFLFDIQDEQLAPLEQYLREQKITISQIAPFIRARILRVNGAEFERNQTGSYSTREEEVDARFRNRGINLSYRDTLSNAEKTLSGKNWSELNRDPEHIEISVEQNYADRLKLKMGDVLRFDIQGVELDARIASLREVNWNSFEPNFFIVFPTGTLTDAPKTWILTVKRSGAFAPAKIQAMLASRFANVTSINVQEALDNVSELFTKLSGGLKVASALCLALGLFVFLMILLFQLASSQKDWSQLKVLGLNRREILTLQLLTYGGLCFIGSLFGAGLSLLMAFALAHFAFSVTLEIDWLKMIQVFVLTQMGAWIGMIWLGWIMAVRYSLKDLLSE